MSEFEKFSDEELLEYAAQVNAELRRGRRLKEAGDIVIRDNIQLWANCQSEMNIRMHQRIEVATDRLVEGQDK